EQHFVHRDIKPSNIMVRLKDDGGIMAKIIDLGLAKAISEANLETAISTPGGFVGTPEFASLEQFAGLALDTRSDSANRSFSPPLLLAGQVDSRRLESQGRATSRELCPTAGEAPGLNRQLL